MIGFQCSDLFPSISDHPNWFDGTFESLGVRLTAVWLVNTKLYNVLRFGFTKCAQTPVVNTRMIANSTQFFGHHKQWPFTFKAYCAAVDANLRRLMVQAAASGTTVTKTGHEDPSRNVYYVVVMSVPRTRR